MPIIIVILKPLVSPWVLYARLVAKGSYALFMVTFSAYAEPKTDWCQRDVRMPSMIDVGPSETATAYIPNAAAVPCLDSAKFTNTMAIKIPKPHTHTAIIRE